MHKIIKDVCLEGEAEVSFDIEDVLEFMSYASKEDMIEIKNAIMEIYEEEIEDEMSIQFTSLGEQVKYDRMMEILDKISEEELNELEKKYE